MFNRPVKEDAKANRCGPEVSRNNGSGGRMSEEMVTSTQGETIEASRPRSFGCELACDIEQQVHRRVNAVKGKRSPFITRAL